VLQVLLLLLLLVFPAGALEWTHQPASGAQVISFRPEIALYFPAGTSLAHQKARMFLDDQDVTDECVKTGLFISYRPQKPLRRGPHQVRVEVGENRQSWDFEVVGSKLIQGCVFDVPAQTKAFDKVKVEMRGQTRGKGWAELVGYPDKYPLKEVRGLYRGEFKVPAKLAGKSAQVEVFLEHQDQLDRQFCEGLLTIAAQNLSVQWLNPENGATVEQRVRAQGQALPECSVEIRVKTFFRDGVEFGKLPPPSRHTVKCDSEGKFVFDYSFPGGLPRLGVTLVAVAYDPMENRSEPAGLLLYLGRSVKLPPLRHDAPPPR
jgi:hypothetical protein